MARLSSKILDIGKSLISVKPRPVSFLWLSRASYLTPSARAAASVDVVEPAAVHEPELEKSSMSGKARPLSIDPSSQLRVVDPEPHGWRAAALKLLGFYSRESRLIRGSRTLYSRVCSQVEKPELYATFCLEQSFRTTHAMLVIHLWLLLARLRAEGKDGALVGQTVYEIFNFDLEQRIVAQGVKVLISKWMKELEKNFYGAVSAYDAAMQPGVSQDELTRALWRNVFAENDAIMPSGSVVAPVQALARYVRTETACLSITDSESILSGNILFSQSGTLEGEK